MLGHFSDSFVGYFYQNFKGLWITFQRFLVFVCPIVENSVIVKTSTAPTRELNFEGLEGFSSVYFGCF